MNQSDIKFPEFPDILNPATIIEYYIKFFIMLYKIIRNKLKRKIY